MIKLLYTAALFLSVLTATAQDPFKKYEDMSDVSAMIMDSNMFRLLSRIDFDSSDPETKAYLDLVENIENIKVFSSEDASKQAMMKKDLDSYVSGSSLENMVSGSENGQKATLYSRPVQSNSKVSELILLLDDHSKEKPSTTLVTITGDIDIKQVFKLAKDLDLPGNQLLKNL